MSDYINDALVSAINDMLKRRAEAGNCQSKHGLDAAYNYEVFRFIDALDKLTKDHTP